MQNELVQHSGPEAVDRLFNLFGKLRLKSDVPRFEDAEWRSQDHPVEILAMAVAEGQLHSSFNRVVNHLDRLVELDGKTSLEDVDNLGHTMGQDIFRPLK